MRAGILPLASFFFFCWRRVFNWLSRVREGPVDVPGWLGRSWLKLDEDGCDWMFLDVPETRVGYRACGKEGAAVLPLYLSRAPI